MSIETLIQAAQYVEMQEQQKQASPLKLQHHNQSPVPAPAPITVTTPIRARQDPCNFSRYLSTQNETPDKHSELLFNLFCSVDTVVSTATQPTIQIQAATAATVPQRVIRNSFDMINPLVIDEGGEAKRKQPPLVFRSGTREVHNKLEKHRRAHLKECFDALKKGLPGTSDEKKASNLNILHSAIKCIHNLKKRDLENEREMERLAREKITLQQKLALLKKDVPLHCEIDYSTMLPEVTAAETSAVVKFDSMEEVRRGVNEDANANNTKPMDVQVSISNDLKVTKSITRALPVVTTNSVNGIKEGVLPQTTQVQTTALSVVPIGYQMNQGLVLQKVIVPKGITDLSQLVSSPPVAHFIATPQQLNGKVVPLVNAQYVMKPLVVVSTPSRPS